MFIPWPCYVWILISTLGVIYDTLYIQLRPLTFRHNIYEWKFEPYQLYQFFDTLKVNMDDQFVVIQSWLNVVEVSLLWLIVLISLVPNKRVKFWAAMMLIAVSACVFWKTVIYLWYDRRFITVSLERLYSIAVAFYYFTIGPWLIFPLLTIFATSRRVIQAALKDEVSESKGKKGKVN